MFNQCIIKLASLKHFDPQLWVIPSMFLSPVSLLQSLDFAYTLLPAKFFSTVILRVVLLLCITLSLKPLSPFSWAPFWFTNLCTKSIPHKHTHINTRSQYPCMCEAMLCFLVLSLLTIIFFSNTTMFLENLQFYLFIFYFVAVQSPIMYMQHRLLDLPLLMGLIPFACYWEEGGDNHGCENISVTGHRTIRVYAQQ